MRPVHWMFLIPGVLALSLAVSCAAGSISTTQTNNPNFQVELLFEHEGVRVYRFTDAGYRHYYAVPKDGRSAWVETPVHKRSPETIDTLPAR